jgi:hypothetical protein
MPSAELQALKDSLQEGDTVLLIRVDAAGNFKAYFPDNVVTALGLLEYAHEQVMEKSVRPSMQSRIAIAGQAN